MHDVSRGRLVVDHGNENLFHTNLRVKFNMPRYVFSNRLVNEYSMRSRARAIPASLYQLILRSTIIAQLVTLIVTPAASAVRRGLHFRSPRLEVTLAHPASRPRHRSWNLHRDLTASLPHPGYPAGEKCQGLSGVWRIDEFALDTLAR